MSWRGWGAFAALGIIWGLPYFFIKLSVQELSPVVVAFGRVSLGAAILMPIAWRRGALQSLGKHKSAICAFALAEFVIPFSVISYGERWIDSSVTGILIAMVPLSIALIQRFFGVHEHLGRWRILGLALGFVGVASLVGFGSISGPWGWAGVACMFVATLGYAIGPLIIQRHLAGLDPLVHWPRVCWSQAWCCAFPPCWLFPRTCRRCRCWHRWRCWACCARRWRCC